MSIVNGRIIQYSTELAAKLAQLMEKKGFGIKRLSSESGLSRNRIRQALHGDKLQEDELKRICGALGLTAEAGDLLIARFENSKDGFRKLHCETWGSVSRKISSSDIDHPERYGGDTAYECIKVLKSWLSPDEYRGFLKGNAIKYLCRIGKKDEPSQEAAKAGWYVKELEKSYKID